MVGAVVAMSLLANPVMARQGVEGKPQQEFKGPLKVFILAGQSNMEGLGVVSTLDRLGEHPTYGYLLKKIRKDDCSFVVRDDVFVSYQIAKNEPERHVCNWYCDYQGSAWLTPWSVTVWPRR
jgi:hypothetical protein